MSVTTVGLVFIGDTSYPFPSSSVGTPPVTTVVLAGGARLVFSSNVQVLTKERGYVDPSTLLTTDFLVLLLPNQVGQLTVERDTSVVHNFLQVQRTLSVQVAQVLSSPQGSQVAPIGTPVTWNTTLLGSAPQVPGSPEPYSAYCLCLVPGSGKTCDPLDEEDLTASVVWTQ